MRKYVLAAALAACAAAPAFAQGRPPEDIDFAGGKLTIADAPDEKRALSFNGKELASDYQVGLDRVAKVGNAEVALFYVGSGGNACSPQTLIVWKPEGGELKTQAVGDDCDAASPSVSNEFVTFTPYVGPGETSDVWRWSPDRGLELAGKLSFAPTPGRTWDTLKTGEPAYPFEAMANASVYAAAEKMLGPDLAKVAQGFNVSGRMERLADGMLTGSGCVPHACGVSDSFIAVDPDEQKVFLAQQAEGGGEPKTWPAVGEWPPEALEAMHKALIKE